MPGVCKEVSDFPKVAQPASPAQSLQPWLEQSELPPKSFFPLPVLAHRGGDPYPGTAPCGRRCDAHPRANAVDTSSPPRRGRLTHRPLAAHATYRRQFRLLRKLRPSVNRLQGLRLAGRAEPVKCFAPHCPYQKPITL